MEFQSNNTLLTALDLRQMTLRCGYKNAVNHLLLAPGDAAAFTGAAASVTVTHE
ncbi:MAG: hypothetical protein V4754_13445 [Pseudomonadota bacterium]